MSLFENLLICQTEKQLSLLQEQSKYFNEWLQFEQGLIDMFVVQENFAGGHVSDLWEGALIRHYDSSIEIKGKWTSFSGICAEEGLHIRDRIIRCKRPVSLKALAAEVRVNLMLALNAEVWILTRGLDIKDPAACILKISKESEIGGTFIVFGAPIGNENEFVFFKRQQIPEEKAEPDKSYSQIDLKIKDNGDDRVFVSVKMDTMQKERSSLGIIIEASKRQQCCSIS
jgi:hypothetical protein